MSVPHEWPALSEGEVRALGRLFGAWGRANPHLPVFEAFLAGARALRSLEQPAAPPSGDCGCPCHGNPDMRHVMACCESTLAL